MLFNEPKLLKSFVTTPTGTVYGTPFGALQRAEIAEILQPDLRRERRDGNLVLFNEPKLLKSLHQPDRRQLDERFGALQRAEIAEILL